MSNQVEGQSVNPNDAKPVVMCSQSDDDAFVDWYMSQQPILTEDEQRAKVEELNRCADFILKHGITPNLDSIY